MVAENGDVAFGYLKSTDVTCPDDSWARVAFYVPCLEQQHGQPRAGGPCRHCQKNRGGLSFRRAGNGRHNLQAFA